MYSFLSWAIPSQPCIVSLIPAFIYWLTDEKGNVINIPLKRVKNSSTNRRTQSARLPLYGMKIAESRYLPDSWLTTKREQAEQNEAGYPRLLQLLLPPMGIHPSKCSTCCSEAVRIMVWSCEEEKKNSAYQIYSHRYDEPWVPDCGIAAVLDYSIVAVHRYVNKALKE